MKLRLLEIRNFRGIKELTWKPSPGFNLLLGSGDSGKTTILDAIDYALSPRWSLAFTDADFYDCETSEPISIKATVGNLSKKLKANLHFETHYRGWSGNDLHDEPRDDEDGEDELVLTIHLEVKSDLEPSWVVWTERDVEIRPSFRSSDRDDLGVVRVGAYVDRHLSWGRGSALSQYSDSIDNLHPVFAKVRRDTQSSFDQQPLPTLRSVTSNLNTKAQEMGVQMSSELKPGLEITALQSSAAAVSLFDGSIPTRQMGLGSRRLLVTTMQLEKGSEKSLLLVDEIESALEPHRIRRLVRTLAKSELQLIVSTHSPIAVQEATEQTIHFVQRNKGLIVLKELPQLIRANLKQSPYAALAKRVLVCEGKTEQGFLAACKSIWEKKHQIDLDALGIGEAWGSGLPSGGKLALAFAGLGISTGFYFDADRGAGFDPKTATGLGLATFTYSPGFNSEKALFSSIDDAGVTLILNDLLDSGRVPNMRAVLNAFFEIPSAQTALWSDAIKPRPSFSSKVDALYAASLGNRQREPLYPEISINWNPWFKDTDVARSALETVIGSWDTFKLTELGKPLEKIRVWCYGA